MPAKKKAAVKKRRPSRSAPISDKIVDTPRLVAFDVFSVAVEELEKLKMRVDALERREYERLYPTPKGEKYSQVLAKF